MDGCDSIGRSSNCDVIGQNSVYCRGMKQSEDEAFYIG